MIRITDRLMMEEISKEQVKEKMSRCDYVIAHMISSLKYGRLVEAEIDWEELVELRAFNQREEFRILETDGGQKAIWVYENEEGMSEKPDRDVIERRYSTWDGNILQVKEYLTRDEDGQAVVAYTRPFRVSKEHSSWKEEVRL